MVEFVGWANKRSVEIGPPSHVLPTVVAHKDSTAVKTLQANASRFVPFNGNRTFRVRAPEAAPIETKGYKKINHGLPVMAFYFHQYFTTLNYLVFCRP